MNQLQRRARHYVSLFFWLLGYCLLALGLFFLLVLLRHAGVIPV